MPEDRVGFFTRQDLKTAGRKAVRRRAPPTAETFWRLGLRGLGITLVTAGLMSMAFMVFSGIQL